MMPFMKWRLLATLPTRLEYTLKSSVCLNLASFLLDMNGLLLISILFCLFFDVPPKFFFITKRYDGNNPEHVALKEGIEVGNGLPELPKPQVVIDALKEAGFEIIETYHKNRV